MYLFNASGPPSPSFRRDPDLRLFEVDKQLMDPFVGALLKLANLDIESPPLDELQAEDTEVFLMDQIKQIVCGQFKWYMPSQDSNWLAPPLNFIALSMLRPDGSYERPDHLSHLIAAMQYVVRLAFAEDFSERNSQPVVFNPSLKPTEDTAAQEDWSTFKFLRKGTLGPFSRMRDLMHLVSAVIRNDQLPNRTQWVDSELKILNVDGKQFSIDDARDCIHRIDTRCEERYLRVVQGAKMPPFHASEYSDKPHDTRVGFNYLRDSQAHHNQYHLHLIKEWMQRGDPKGLLSMGWKTLLKHTSIEDPSMWHLGNVQKWLDEADMWLEELYFLYHVASGQPGRGTEEMATQIVNSTASCRNVFFRGDRMVVVTWYHKGQNMTHASKPRMTALSGAHTKLLHYLIGFVRPVQM